MISNRLSPPFLRLVVRTRDTVNNEDNDNHDDHHRYDLSGIILGIFHGFALGK
jgi:hypothetical protein